MEKLLKQIIANDKKPPLYEYTGELFWNDPHISKQMLKAHLNPEHDAASRNPRAISATVNHLFDQGILKAGMRVLDLGCGPGLYSELIQAKGAHVVGIDGSENSIAYAKERSERLGLGITYLHMDFFEMPFEQEFDVVLQIYGELNTFSPENRDRLLSLIKRALKDNGRFAFDVTNRANRDPAATNPTWYTSESGFWSGEPHLVLEQAYDYPEASAWVDQYIVIDTKGVKAYRNWFNDHDVQSITEVMTHNDFQIEHCWGDLAWAPLTESDKWIGIVARKAV
ncbi:MAG: methyltransferase domain-containing protein [Firmicutes bacterium]|nr:methyltransferase domain-containing protein [Bacillota bacterium]